MLASCRRPSDDSKKIITWRGLRPRAPKTLGRDGQIRGTGALAAAETMFGFLVWWRLRKGRAKRKKSLHVVLRELAQQDLHAPARDVAGVRVVEGRERREEARALMLGFDPEHAALRVGRRVSHAVKFNAAGEGVVTEVAVAAPFALWLRFLADRDHELVLSVWFEAMLSCFYVIDFGCMVYSRCDVISQLTL